jgi:PAS domain S-box-containing protein
MKSLPDRENGVQTSEPTFGSRASEILETIGDGFCAIDRDSRIVYVNSRAAKMWGSTPKKMTNGFFWDWSPKLIGTAAEKLLRRAIVSSSRADCETFSPIRGLWLWVRVCPIPGGLTGIYWRDISDRKSAEGALRDSEERFRRVFEQNPLGMATADLDGRLREVNPALCQMLGYTAEELNRLSYLDIVHPDDREECAHQGRAAAAGAREGADADTATGYGLPRPPVGPRQSAKG